MVLQPEPSGKKVLLVVSECPVWPYRDGFTLRTIEILNELHKDWDLVLIAPVHEKCSADEEPFPVILRLTPPLAPRTESFPRTSQPELVSAVREALRKVRPHAVLTWGFREIPSDLRRMLPPIIYDMIDCGTLTYFRAVLRSGSLRQRWWDLRLLFQNIGTDRAIVRKNAVTITVGEKDATVLRTVSARPNNIRIISNGVRLQALRQPNELSGQPTITFSGVLAFPPNVDAALFFADQVFPKIQRRIPEVRYIVAGRSPVESISALASRTGIEVHADVPDMFALLRQSWLCVAPMRSGAGVKNKILEAWAVGAPVVMSDVAANGIALDPCFEPLICTSADMMAERTIALLQDKTKLLKLGADLHGIAAQRHSWKTIGSQFNELLNAHSVNS